MTHPGSAPIAAHQDSLPLTSLHAHLSTLDSPDHFRAYRRLADDANDRLHIAAVRVVLDLVPGAAQLSWRRAPRSEADAPPVTDLTLDDAHGAGQPLPLHEELDSLDIEVPVRFAHLLPANADDLGDGLEHTLIERLAADAHLSVPDYQLLVQAANVVVTLHPSLEVVPMRE